MILNTKSIQIGYDRSVNPSQIDIGMQHENGVTKILFEFGEEFNFTDERLYFIVTDGNTSFAYPLVDNAVVVGSEITQKKAYTANFVISKSEIKDSIDKNNVMWISNDIRLMVTLNSINVESIESEVLPVQFQIIYDDLLDLKKDLEDKLASGYFKGEKGDPGEVGPKGDTGEKGDPGQDYVLTEDDKTEIAGVVKAEVSEDINNLNNKTDELKGDLGELKSLTVINLAFATNDNYNTNNITITKQNDGTNIINGTPTSNIGITINEFTAERDATLKLSGFDSDHNTSIIYLTDTTSGQYSSNCYGGDSINVNIVCGHHYKVDIYIPGYTNWDNYTLDAKLYFNRKKDSIEMLPICLTSNNINTYLYDVNNALPNTKYRISSRVIPQNMPPRMINPLNCYVETQTTDSGNIQYIKDFSTDKVLWKRLHTGTWESIEHNISVGLGYGDWDFSSLYEALLFAYANENTTITVYDGTYDIIAEMGSNLTSESIGILIGKNMTINFKPHAYVICNYTGDDENIKGIFSPFYSGMGDYEINNMKLLCSNVRYCVHDEKSNGEDAYSHKYNNCSFYLDNRDNANGYPQCIGGGLGVNGHIEIVGCSFKSETISESGEKAEASYHNSSASGAKSEVVVKDNYFENGTFRISYYGKSTEKTVAFVSNNRMKYVPFVSQESASYDNVNVELRAWNNVVN